MIARDLLGNRVDVGATVLIFRPVGSTICKVEQIESNDIVVVRSVFDLTQDGKLSVRPQARERAVAPFLLVLK